MGDSYSGVRLVDVLSTCTTCSVGIKSVVFRLDFNLNVIIDFRRCIYRSKGGVSSLCSVIWADSHQPVDSGLTLEVAEGIVS